MAEEVSREVTFPTDTRHHLVVQQVAGQLNDGEPEGYTEWYAALKQRIRATQVRAARMANTEILRLYWATGHDILERQERDGWGSKVVERVARDMKRDFPDQRGWSRTNLLYMRRAAEVWSTESDFVQHVAGQLPWGHIIVLLDRLGTREERDWYAAQAAEHGWTRGVLEHFIKVDLRMNLGTAPTNFKMVLEPPDSDLAQQLVKDPYLFEGLDMSERVSEREVEQTLMDRLQDTLVEFGRGMAFVGRQVHLRVVDEHGDVDEFIPDLILYNIPQARYVVIELKVGKFDPAYLGQLGTYVSVVDGQLRDREKQASTIGMLLCTSKNEATVRYALASLTSAVGVADYQGLPSDARAVLPSEEELQAVIAEEQKAIEERANYKGEIPRG